jgi:hypothetical protein
MADLRVEMVEAEEERINARRAAVKEQEKRDAEAKAAKQARKETAKA